MYVSPCSLTYMKDCVAFNCISATKIQTFVLFKTFKVGFFGFYRTSDARLHFIQQVKHYLDDQIYQLLSMSNAYY